MAYKVLIPQEIAQEGVDELLRFGYEVKMGTGTGEEDLIRDVADCDAILLRTAQVPRTVLEAGKKLKIVAIWVTNAPDSTTNSVAEFVLGAIIAAAKRMFLLHEALRRKDFYFKNSHKGIDLEGKTLGIVGFGRIGSRVAQKAFYGLDMKILAYSPHITEAQAPDYVLSLIHI